MEKTSNRITFTEQKKIVEIREWYLATDKNTGITKDPVLGWSTDISQHQLNEDKKYLWNYEEIVYSIGDSDKSIPAIIGIYGTGTGIGGIENFYTITSDLYLPDGALDGDGNVILDANGNPNPDIWRASLDEEYKLDPVNRYLWNCEKITYTGTSTAPTITTPVIIGVYGDSGITIDIYSKEGLQFNDDVEVINLKVAAFKGVDEITEKTLLWEWKDTSGDETSYKEIYNPVVYTGQPDIFQEGDGWKLIEGENYTDDEGVVYNYDSTKDTILVALKDSSTTLDESQKYWTYDDSANFDPVVIDNGNTLSINKNSKYATANLRCTVKCEGIEEAYTRYITLTNEVEIYIAGIKFLKDTNNVLGADDEYMLASVSIYKNNEEIDALVSEEVYEIQSTLNNDGIRKYNFPIPADGIEEEEYIYFIDTADNYNIVLAQYLDSQWTLVETTPYAYSYGHGTVESLISEDISSKLILVKKTDINQKAIIDFTVSKKYSTDILASTSITVIDLNDPIMSTEPPKNPKIGQLWMDMNVSPYMLMIYVSDEEGWQKSNYQEGGVVYTSKPQTYRINDLWVLGNEESYPIINPDGTKTEFGPGSMLKSTINYSQTKYLEKPTTYKHGDIWVLADGESYNTIDANGNAVSFGAGSKLKALVDSSNANVPESERWVQASDADDLSDTNIKGKSHWIEALEGTTDVIKNSRQSFDWTDGLKISQEQNDGKTPFYVQIKSDKMGFHNVEYDDTNVETSDIEVVHIGNQSARIIDATLTGKYDESGDIQGRTTINQNVDVYGSVSLYNGPYAVDKNWEPKVLNGKSVKPTTGFQLKIETDGSLSLVILE